MKDKKNKSGKILLSSIMVFIMAFSVMPAKVYAAENNPSTENVTSPKSGEVEINETTFPDSVFRSYVKNYIDTNGDSKLSPTEIEKKTAMALWEKGIKDLKGIEYFTSLEELFCYGNQLTSLDVSKNASLKVLECYKNNITTLDVSNNIALTELRCSRNLLTSLDVSKNTKLTRLICDNNQLTELTLSENIGLDRLYCDKNQLTNLDISKNIALTDLNCADNKLVSLDVSNNTILKELICNRNQLTNLNASNNPALTRIWCDKNQLMSLDVSKSVNLTDFELDFQERTIVYENNNEYLLSNYDSSFDKNKVSTVNNATWTSDGILTDVKKDTPVTYYYDCGHVGNKNLKVKLSFRDLTDEEKLNKAKPLAEAEIDKTSVTNDTTEESILDAVSKIISSIDGVTASWKTGSPTITPATKNSEGSITGTIVLTSGNKTVEITVNKVIDKLPLTDEDRLNSAKPLAEKTISDITATNDTTEKSILDVVSTGISSVDGVTASWKDGSPIITKATSDKTGSITGTIILTCGNKTIEITVNKVIKKLPPITTIVDKTTGTEIEYEDGSVFADDITLVVTPKSTEEMKEFQDNVNKVVTGKSIAGVYDIKLLKNGVEIQPNGKLKITLTLTDEMKAMSDLQVVYIDDNGKVTIIPSQLVDGKLVFITDHFSYYGVIGKAISIAPINPTKPDYIETVKPTLPKTEDKTNSMLYLGLVVLSGFLAGYGLKQKKVLKR